MVDDELVKDRKREKKLKREKKEKRREESGDEGKESVGGNEMYALNNGSRIEKENIENDERKRKKRERKELKRKLRNDSTAELNSDILEPPTKPKYNPYLSHLETQQQQPHGDQRTLNPFTQIPFSSTYYSILSVRESLPVYEKKSEIFELLNSHNVFILVGETGSGKTTQVPQFVTEFMRNQQSKGVVACTQPRRVAATSVAKRVAQEMDVTLGSHVGYTIRFDDCTDSQTVLKYCTDGMLLREAMIDPNLSRYSCIIIDEAHERTLSTDVLMGTLKELVCKTRSNDLKLIIMSATLDAKKFQKYFENPPLLSVSGRMFPVEIMYSESPEVDYFEAAVRTAVYIHLNEKAGDILLFLTGEEEIEDAVERIYSELTPTEESSGPVCVLPLYSTLPQHEQQKVFEPAPTTKSKKVGRKVICATNIAETSLTIDGVVYVIDPGFSKQKIYDPRTRVESLQVAPISRASAKQRAGRAGRTRPGKCFRLYTKESFESDLIDTTYPEILRSNLSSVVLNLLKLGIRDLVHFDFLDPPAPETLIRALEQLHYLGAIDDEGALTQIGHQMSELPLNPEMCKMLLVSPQHQCSNEILTLCAMLSTSGIVFLRPRNAAKLADRARRKFIHRDGDHMTLLNVFHGFKQNERKNQKDWCWENFLNYRVLSQAESVRSQLSKLVKKIGLSLESPDFSRTDQFSISIRKCLVEGYFMQVAFKQGGKETKYLTVKDNQLVALHPSCGLSYRPDWILYDEYVLTKQSFIRTCSTIDPDWLLDIAPHYYDLGNFPECAAKFELSLLTARRSKLR
eukprot:CAMPEP_0182443068 /NCGR_PEP_ID=MMETSP1172-20130603/1905_1 /TAXON_ID=708627 /ORGANISM="Timspurckia oligopyrenoides, Strain CCMP3278" /LENGTH=797 /DNA_ID=CAMNT_0024638233 /DNA_START=114 /DNA_END=2507 /DNA_ORIENTATION=+